MYDDKIVAVDYDDIARWWTDERCADDDDDVDAMNTAPAFEETLVERPAMLLALIALAVHQVCGDLRPCASSNSQPHNHIRSCYAAMMVHWKRPSPSLTKS